MGIRTLFRKSNSRNLKAQAYDNQVASDAPIRGTFPVAGNGPNVLSELQKSHMRRTSVSSTAPAPNVPRNRSEQSCTAPHNGEPGGGNDGRPPTNDFESARRRSDCSMTCAPGFFSRRSSIENPKARRTSWLRKAGSPPEFGAPIKTHGHVEDRSHERFREHLERGKSALQPSGRKRGASTSSSNNYYPPTSNSSLYLERTDSQALYTSHVDILEAYTNTHKEEGLQKQRREASGRRQYGEDVADRNIRPEVGRRSQPSSQGNLSLYSERKTIITTGQTQSPGDSALEHTLADLSIDDDDKSQPPTSDLSRTRPRKSYPPRTDSSSSHVALRNARVESQKLPPKRLTSNESADRKHRITYSVSSTLSSDDECLIRYHKPRSPVPVVPNMPVTVRGRSRTSLPAVYKGHLLPSPLGPKPDQLQNTFCTASLDL